jgi:hypothetical protein
MALGGEVTYLIAAGVANLKSPNWYDRAWELWKRKAQAQMR